MVSQCSTQGHPFRPGVINRNRVVQSQEGYAQWERSRRGESAGITATRHAEPTRQAPDTRKPALGRVLCCSGCQPWLYAGLLRWIFIVPRPGRHSRSLPWGWVWCLALGLLKNSVEGTAQFKHAFGTAVSQTTRKTGRWEEREEDRRTDLKT